MDVALLKMLFMTLARWRLVSKENESCAEHDISIHGCVHKRPGLANSNTTKRTFFGVLSVLTMCLTFHA